MDTTTSASAHHEHSRRCWWDHTQARWACPDPSADRCDEIRAHRSPAADPPLVDVRDMVVVHTAMLREFRLAPAAVRRTAAGDRRHARAVAADLRLLCDLLHHHHEGEDRLLWPLLQERLPASTLAAVERAEAQHAEIDTALGRVNELLAAWVEAPEADRGDRLAAGLEQLHVVLRDHLDTEERTLLPLAAALLSEPEWRAIGEAGAAAVPRSALLLVFGMFAYEGDPVVLAEMLGEAPPPARALVRLAAPRAYARRARRIHGTARP